MFKSHTFGIRTVVGAVALALSAISILSPAQAVPTQGGTEGRIFTSNMAHGAVYTGNFGNPVGAESIFWQEAGSQVDSVSSTLTRVAWSSDQNDAPNSSALYHKVFIADVALTAGSITQVSFTEGISALTSDPANERFYATSGDELWAFNSDGTNKTLVYTAQNYEFAAVGWGLAIDGVNHKAYIGSEGTIFVLDLGADNVTGDNLTELYTGLGGVDGIAVDAVAGLIYYANYDGEPGIAKAKLDGSGDLTPIFATVPLVGGGTGVAPSGVILNAQLGKMYFTVEQGVYESNLDGTSLRELYGRGQTESGYENIAIAFGSFDFGSVVNPTITTVSPASGTVDGGTTVTITGTGFAAGATVLIGGVACTVVTRTATQITCTTGAHAAALVNVVVTNTDTGTVTKANAYTYIPNGVVNPTITTVSPASGTVDGGTTVTITGTGFAAGATVLIGGVACTVVTRTATQITCTTGAHAAALVDVVVTNTDSGTATKSNGYTYIPNGVTNPTITTVSPTSGTTAGGRTVTIKGTGFKAGATVLIGGVACTVVTRTSTQITCTTGAHAAELVDVVVTNTDSGTATKSNSYRYVAPAAPGTQTIKKTVYFASSAWKLSAKAAKTLSDFAALVPAGAIDVRIKITGFVQPSPDKANDAVLSLARAKSIKWALKRAGITGSWIVSGEGRATGDPVKARRGRVELTYTVAG